MVLKIFVIFLGLFIVGFIYFQLTGKSTSEVLCSELKGQMLDSSGAPTPKIKIVRVWHWRGNQQQDETVTDSNGHFAFPEVPLEKSIFDFLPQEKVVVQRYYAFSNLEKFEFLNISRHDYKVNSESGGKPFNIVCRAGVAPTSNKFAWGICELKD